MFASQTLTILRCFFKVNQSAGESGGGPPHSKTLARMNYRGIRLANNLRRQTSAIFSAEKSIFVEPGGTMETFLILIAIT